MPEGYTIGVLSRESGVKVETIRYYERSGLLSPPARAASGYRRYGEGDIKRLRFIRRGRELGFGMGEIKTLLQLADQPQQPCHEADQMVQAHLVEIDAKIRDLQAIRAVLEQIAQCPSQTAEHCYLLETLDQRVCCLPEH
jgi:Hg(II)-responsive transcriptional regulator